MADKALDRNSSNLNDELYDHHWGFKDSHFVINPDQTVGFTGQRYELSGTTMPEFMPFAEEILEIKVNYRDLKKELTLDEKPAPEPIVHKRFFNALKKAFPESQYSSDKRERLIHSHGQTTADEVYKVLYGALDRVCDLVFWPESEEDCVAIIALANRHNICLVPYGGGTSVSCALQLPENETRMIVVMDTRRMNKIEWIDRTNFQACVQAGITGKELEEKLAAQGFTSGHEPDSMELSTLGGWVATNASGMKKNRYGNIEDIVQTVSMITPKGVVEQHEALPRLSMGMQPQQLMFGSEGNLGLITKAVIRIHKLPEVTKFNSFVFKDFKTGVDFMYALTQTGVLPASIRLLDNIQFRFGSALKPKPTPKQRVMSEVQKQFLLRVKKFGGHDFSAATVVMEGSAEEVAHQEKVVLKLVKKFNGIVGGETNGKRGYMLTYAIAYIRDFLSSYHIVGETYETTVPWSRVMEVIEAVDKKGREMHKAYGLPGKAYISPRVTQLYHTGVCIYFTHGFSAQGVDNPAKIFSEIDHEMRKVIMDHGGSISHHHGIGKLRKDFLPRSVSAPGVEMLKQAKKASDPKNVFGIRNNVFAD